MRVHQSVASRRCRKVVPTELRLEFCAKMQAKVLEMDAGPKSSGWRAEADVTGSKSGRGLAFSVSGGKGLGLRSICCIQRRS